MRKDKGRLAGILGTIILHLIAGIIFMSLQLRSLQKTISNEYEVELAPEPEPVKQKEKLPRYLLHQLIKFSKEMRRCSISPEISQTSPQRK